MFKFIFALIFFRYCLAVLCSYEWIWGCFGKATSFNITEICWVTFRKPFSRIRTRLNFVSMIWMYIEITTLSSHNSCVPYWLWIMTSHTTCLFLTVKLLSLSPCSALFGLQLSPLLDITWQQPAVGAWEQKKSKKNALVPALSMIIWVLGGDKGCSHLQEYCKYLQSNNF